MTDEPIQLKRGDFYPARTLTNEEITIVFRYFGLNFKKNLDEAIAEGLSRDHFPNIDLTE